MSQQINLYDPELRRKREFLTLGNLVAMGTTMLMLVVVMGSWERSRLSVFETEARLLAPQIKGMQEQTVAISRMIGGSKVNPQLEAELASARTVLELRGNVVTALGKGVGTDSASFAEYLRGLARQTPTGLWLTAFSIGEGGTGMEIRGRMTDPALLPEYIKRLNGESAFQGRAFAALNVVSVRPPAADPAAAGTAVGTATASGGLIGVANAAQAPLYHEFTLMPKLREDAAGPAPAAGEPAASPLPGEAGRALNEAGLGALGVKR